MLTTAYVHCDLLFLFSHSAIYCYCQVMFCPLAQRVNSSVNPPSCSGRPFGNYGGPCCSPSGQQCNLVLSLHISAHSSSRRSRRYLHAVSLLSTAEFGKIKESMQVAQCSEFPVHLLAHRCQGAFASATLSVSFRAFDETGCA